MTDYYIARSATGSLYFMSGTGEPTWNEEGGFYDLPNEENTENLEESILDDNFLSEIPKGRGSLRKIRPIVPSIIGTIFNCDKNAKKTSPILQVGDKVNKSKGILYKDGTIVNATSDRVTVDWPGVKGDRYYEPSQLDLVSRKVEEKPVRAATGILDKIVTTKPVNISEDQSTLNESDPPPPPWKS